MRLLIGVGADVDQHLVPATAQAGVHRGSPRLTPQHPERLYSPCIEAPPFASTALPVTAVPRILFRFHVEVIDVIHQVLQGVEQQVTLGRKEACVTFLTSAPGS